MIRRIAVGLALTLTGGLLGDFAATTLPVATAPALARGMPPRPDDESTPPRLDRRFLPIPEPKTTPETELDARDAKPPPRFDVKPPGGRPTCSSS